MTEVARGQTAAASTLEVPDFLKDVKLVDAKLSEQATKLYRCGIKPELGYQAVIHVAGVSFATGTFRWEGSGESARQREYSCAFQRLSDEKIARLKELLPYQYLRRTLHPVTKDVLGVEHVDASDAGTPPKRRAGQLQGNEEPLLPYLVFEPVSEHTLPAEGHAMSKEEIALRAAEAVASENEDMLHPESAGQGNSARAALRKAMSTGTAKRKPEAGLLEG